MRFEQATTRKRQRFFVDKEDLRIQVMRDELNHIQGFVVRRKDGKEKTFVVSNTNVLAAWMSVEKFIGKI